MSGYIDTKNLIIAALLGRPVGTEITPASEQAYALSMLDYIRGLELATQSSLTGFAIANTIPIQPDTSRVSYISGVGKGSTITFANFHDVNGSKITITTPVDSGVIAILMWNTKYWEVKTFETNVTAVYQTNNYTRTLNVRKTYALKSDMQADSLSSIGVDGLDINYGEIVSVKGDPTFSNNGFYSKIFEGWELQPFLGYVNPPVRLIQITGEEPDPRALQLGDKYFSVADKNIHSIIRPDGDFLFDDGVTPVSGTIYVYNNLSYVWDGTNLI